MGHTLYEEGHKTRFEIFQTIYETRYKRKKMMFWIHNWHAMKNSPQVLFVFQIPKNAISIGTRLALAHPIAQYVVISSIVACPKCKAPMHDDAFETPFVAILGQGSAFVDIKHPAEHHRHLPFDSSGSLFSKSDNGHFLDVMLNQQFNAIHYLSESKMLNEE